MKDDVFEDIQVVTDCLTISTWKSQISKKSFQMLKALYFYGTDRMSPEMLRLSLTALLMKQTVLYFNTVASIFASLDHSWFVHYTVHEYDRKFQLAVFFVFSKIHMIKSWYKCSWYFSFCEHYQNSFSSICNTSVSDLWISLTILCNKL